MMMIGIVDEDGLGVAAMIVADPGAPHMSAVLGDLRALESELLADLLLLHLQFSLNIAVCYVSCCKGVLQSSPVELD